jgi:hypothetical protein
MKKLLSICLMSILTLISCDRSMESNEVIAQCYKENPIEELPWLKAAIQEFQKPKSGGPLRVSIRVFRNELFFVLANPAVSSPMSYIFNCHGETIDKLGIDYNLFYKESKQIQVIL